MPRIPLSEKGLVQNRQDAVYMQGAPGLGWKLGEGQAVINAGDRIGRGLYGLGRAIKEWGEKERDTNDKLMAQQDLNLFNSTFAQLRQDLADNPGLDDSQKDVMIHEWQTRYAEERKQYTEKMSGDFRKLHDARMLGRSADARNDIGLLLIQGRVQRDMDLANAQFQAALQNCDFETARRIVLDHRGGLYSEEQAKKMELVIDQQTPYFLAKRDIEAGIDIGEALKSGKYGKMPENLKDRLDVYNRNSVARRESEAAKAVHAEFVKGVPPFDEEQLKAMHDRKEISDGLFVMYFGWLKHFKREEKIRSDESMRQQKADKKQQIDRLISDAGHDALGYPRQLDANGFTSAYSQLKKICGDDYSLFGYAQGKLEGLYTRREKIRDTQPYRDGERFIMQAKAEGKLHAVKWFGMKDDASRATVDLVQRDLLIDLENFVIDHPAASASDVEGYMTKRMETYQKSSVDEIGAMAMQRAAARRGMRSAQGRKSVPAEGTTGTFNGKKVVVKDGKWQYQ